MRAGGKNGITDGIGVGGEEDLSLDIGGGPGDTGGGSGASGYVSFSGAAVVGAYGSYQNGGPFGWGGEIGEGLG